MNRLLIIGLNRDNTNRLLPVFTSDGFRITTSYNPPKALSQLSSADIDCIFVTLDNTDETLSFCRQLKRKSSLPLLAELPINAIANLENHLELSDFVINGATAEEISIRLKRLVKKSIRKNSNHIIENGELVIDTHSCEVSINGSLVEFTFREYELLRYLASHKGHIFNRQQLLDRIWGMDYFGGDRTVDVHIRRLRSKI
ncbi:MAG: response regulator transcription factor, partial [Chloroflexi bacterium]|nr:response regulator transcription factor [Chloroflexota bacterium]